MLSHYPNSEQPFCNFSLLTAQSTAGGAGRKDAEDWVKDKERRKSRFRIYKPAGKMLRSS